jgi:diaminopimelate epimerase
MIERIEFAKLSGSGNDFICLDNRDGRFNEMLCSPHRAGHFARVLCCHGMGIGADGVIFGVDSEVEGAAHLGARFFEPDGSEAALCGNGTACFARWVMDNRWVVGPEIKILTSAGVVLGKPSDNGYMRVCIPLPEDTRTNLEVPAGGLTWKCDYILTGVPHLVTYVDDVEAIDVAHFGAALRRSEMFAPRGVNADFVQILGQGRLALRTFESGVEDETLACGTGSAGAAVLAARRFAWGTEYLTGEKPVLVRVRSGDLLRVYLTTDDNGAVTDLCLETVVRFLYHGTIHGDLAETALNAPQAPADRPAR